MSGDNKIIKSIFVVVFISVITKAIGFVKQIVIAAEFGASLETDAFYLAFGLLTSLTYAIFSALSVTFIPMFQKQKLAGENYNNFSKSTLVIFGSGTFLLTVMLIYVAPVISRILVASNSSVDINQVSYYICLLSPLLVIGCVNTILGAILEANKIFAYSKSLGILTSFGVISFVMLFSKYLGVKVLVYGTLFGYIAQFTILIVVVRKFITFNDAKIQFDDNISKLIKLILPLLVGNGIYEINKTVDKILSTSFSAGATSSLAYGQSLYDSLCALTITSTVAVLFSYAAEKVANKDYEGVKLSINNSISMLLLITMPIAILLLINGRELVSLVYGHGSFDTEAIDKTSLILYGYAFGFPFLTFREVLAKAHYAFQDSKTPMKNSIMAVIINIIFSIILSKCIGIQGITIATSISYFVCSIFMMRTIKRHIDYKVLSNAKFYIKLTVATLFMVVFDLVLKSIIGENLYSVLIICAVSIIVFYVLLLLLRCDEIKNLKSLFARK